MNNSEGAYREDARLRFAAVTYYAVMFAAFAIGLYGLFSLFWLASIEIQHNARIVGSVL
jgi:hypothetical protein